MEVYCVNVVDKFYDNFTLGYATTKDKAEKMIEILKEDYRNKGNDDYIIKYKIKYIKLDTLYLDKEEIVIE